MSMIHFGRQVQGRVVRPGQPMSLPPDTYARPRPTGKVVITGSPAAGQTLTATGPSWTGSPALTWAWYLDKTGPVATSNAFLVPAGAAGRVIRAVETAKLPNGLANTAQGQVVTI